LKIILWFFIAVNEILEAFFDKSFYFPCLFLGNRFTIGKTGQKIEFVPKTEAPEQPHLTYIHQEVRYD
jgi:hypothetical protein